MIRYHNTPHTTRPSFDEVNGRICMLSDSTQWGGVQSPFRVTGEDGRGVIGFPLKRTWDDGSRRWVYSDHSDERQDIRVDKKAIKASCDTAAEAMALMEVSIRAQADLLAIRKQAESRIKVLRGIVLPRESDVVMLVLDEQVDWVNPETGKTLLSIYEKDR